MLHYLQNLYLRLFHKKTAMSWIGGQYKFSQSFSFQGEIFVNIFWILMLGFKYLLSQQTYFKHPIQQHFPGLGEEYFILALSIAILKRLQYSAIHADTCNSITIHSQKTAVYGVLIQLDVIYNILLATHLFC